MMLRPSVNDSPSGGAPTKAPRWDLADTEGYSGGDCFLLAPWMFSGYVGIYIGGRSRSVDSRGAHEIGGRLVGGRPPPSWPP